MRHVAQGTPTKKPHKPRSQAQKPIDWRAMVRSAVNKKQGNIKKAIAKSSWKNNRDGFMVTSREHEPTKNQLNSLEEQDKKQIPLKGVKQE